jgi:hypothetical protein
MTRNMFVRFAYPVTILALVAGILILGGFLASVALPDIIRTGSAASPSAGLGGVAGASPSASPAPSSGMGDSPVGIQIPSDANCTACHITTSGGVGVKDIPLLAHPLKGFADCTACHNPAGLVKTAPGHSSIHANQCLICHHENPNLASMSAPPMRPEHMGGQACTTCHGVDKHAPLPSDMAGRGDNCWICHNGPEFQYLFDSPAPGWSAAPRPSSSVVSPPPSAYPLSSPAPSPSPSPSTP